jgi:hypothetical protein
MLSFRCIRRPVTARDFDVINNDDDVKLSEALQTARGFFDMTLDERRQGLET